LGLSLEAHVSRLLHTEIAIAATPEAVWAILADFAAYPDWNPFVRRISGKLEAGATLEVDLAPPGGRAMTMRPTLREVQPGRILRWLGHLGMPGLFDGEHSFQVEPSGEGQVRFVQSEHFSGVLVPLVMRFIGAATEQGFVAMNQALKERAEVMTQDRKATAA
jgi:hypothetical protein